MHRKSSPLMKRNNERNYELARNTGYSNNSITGTIESFTRVYSAPLGFENQAPYILALVSLGNGKKITSQVVDCKEVRIGDKVEPCLRKVYVDGKDGLIHYGTKFRVIK